MDQQQEPVVLSPQHLYYSQYGSVGSYFDYDHVDVIMDDGSRQKRTVSLSTVPRFASSPSLLSPRNASENSRLLSTDHDSNSQQAVIPSSKRIRTQQECFPESDDSDDEPASTTTHTTMDRLTWLLPRTLTTGQKRVLKCSIAYTIGSLFTFIPLLHQWINGGYDPDDEDWTRNAVASHMAATVTVFFMPSKTVGGMVEAAGIGWIMTLGALSVCLASLWTTDYFLGQWNQPFVSYGITLFGWLLTSVLLLAFLKAQYSDRPSVATASSLAFIILFPILVREHTSDESQYSRQRIQDTFAIVAIGSTISAMVCFFIWPQTATRKFNANMNDSLTSLRVLLKLLTKTFLLDADLPDFKANESLAQAIKAHDSSFTALQSSLQEARMEWWWWSNSDEKHKDGDAHDAMVKSIQRLALHIGGLRKSCGLQFDRSHPTASTPTTTKNTDEHMTYHVRGDDHRRKFERTLKREHGTQQDSRARTQATFNVNEDNTSHPYSRSSATRNTHDNDSNDGLVSFIRTVGPPMKSLAFTCKQTIIHLQQQYAPEPSANTATLSSPSFANLRRNLELALNIFEHSQQVALTRLYRRHTMTTSDNNDENGVSDRVSSDTIPSTTHPNNDRPWTLDPSPSAMQTQLLAHLPADDVFLVYFFVFCLIAFAKELVVLVTCMEQVFNQSKKATLMASIVMGIKCIFIGAFRSNSLSPSRPGNQHGVNTLHNPEPKNIIHAFRMGLWRFLTWFRNHKVRYAIKAGLVALALASLAFIPSTKPYFTTYRMEWTLITVMAAMTSTVGGTNFVAVLRLGATVLGVVAGALIYTAFSAYHVAWLVLLTWLISLPCFWMILNQPKHGKFGQFFLLAYNLVVLYRYNHPDVDIFDLAYQRCVAVCLGVIIGLVVTSYIWPYEARKEVRYGLSDLLLKLSWQYYQLNGHDSNNRTRNSGNGTIRGLDATANRENGTTLLDLQQHLYLLSGLLDHTPNEVRLKGRFPYETYQVMLQSCQSILDNFVMMRMVLSTNGNLKDGQGAWTDLVGNVVLYFYVLASALQLKTPLPPYLPPADIARKQLISHLQSSSSSIHAIGTTAAGQLHDASPSSYMTYYAYVVLMETLLYDMDQLADHMKALYGSMILPWIP